MAFFRSDIKPSGLSVDTLAVTTLPTKVSYTVGETLDTTGIVVTATASGMSGDVSSSCTYSPTTLSTTGTIAITVTYQNTTTTFNVTVEEQIGTLEQTSWSTIQRIGAAGTGSQYWAVGDTKSLTIGGSFGGVTIPSASYSQNTTVKAYVIGFNHKSVNGVYFQCFIANYSGTDKKVGFNDPLGAGTQKTDGSKVFNMNHWGNFSYGGWKGCDLRYDILGSTDTAPSGYGSAVASGRTGYDASSTTATNPVSNTLMAALPSDLRAVMAPMTIYTDNVGEADTAGNVTASVDYLPLLAEYEIFGNSTYANSAEAGYQAQFTYYANGGDKKVNLYTNGKTTVYITRTYYGKGATSARNRFMILNSSASKDYYDANRVCTLTPIFRVA